MQTPFCPNGMLCALYQKLHVQLEQIIPFFSKSKKGCSASTEI